MQLCVIFISPQRCEGSGHHSWCAPRCPHYTKYLHLYSFHFPPWGSCASREHSLAWWSAHAAVYSDGDSVRSPLKILILAWLQVRRCSFESDVRAGLLS